MVGVAGSEICNDCKFQKGFLSGYSQLSAGYPCTGRRGRIVPVFLPVDNGGLVLQGGRQGSQGKLRLRSGHVRHCAGLARSRMQEGPFRNLYADCAVSIRDRVRNRRSHAPFRQVHGICRFFRVFPERPCDMVCRPFFPAGSLALSLPRAAEENTTSTFWAASIMAQESATFFTRYFLLLFSIVVQVCFSFFLLKERFAFSSL